MITTDVEYRRVESEVASLNEWLAGLNRDVEGMRQRASVRKKLMRLHEELFNYEAASLGSLPISRSEPAETLEMPIA